MRIKGNSVLTRSFIMAISGGYIPAGIAYGALAAAFHMPVLFILLLSIIVYSGALQSAALGLWAVAANPILVILIGFLVNLRLTLYGPHLQGIKNSWTVGDIWKISGLLTDEVYAVGIAAPEMSSNWFLRIALFSYGSWILGTVIGITAASLIPAYWLFPLTFALPALFLGLMVPRIRDYASVVTVLVAVALSAIGKILALPPEYTIIPIIAGAFAGYFFLKIRGGDVRSTTSGLP